MIRNEYRPLNNKFRLFGYIVSLVGLFKITIPQNQWLLIPILIQNFYTLRALKNGPHKDIFREFKINVSPLKDLLRIFIVGLVGFLYGINVSAGFLVIIYSITLERFTAGLLGILCAGSTLYLVLITFNPDFGSNINQKSLNPKEDKTLSDVQVNWVKDKVDSFTTRLPEKETIERLGNIYNLTVTASEKIYQDAKKVSKNRGKSLPDLEDINKILSESALQRLTFNEMGGLSIDHEYKEPKKSKRENSLIKKRDIKSSLPKNSSTKDQLKEYKQLFDEGLISEEEYTLLKKKALDM
ncbi:SHOCT domain-containing protein [Prochlorococcus marinus XMU1402]|uniref:SHOCT domain-containing protein n=1 Tax=Prochlorococcus marinus TaxID=1219 RepID=UPI001ADCCD73|nr:SHOCT domain-containing protein [Prochlorococcus marinus]MBO8232602.1 SHOCT domain-containing protein [Prochlorococcus marinus XMU1402]